MGSGGRRFDSFSSANVKVPISVRSNELSWWYVDADSGVTSNIIPSELTQYGSGGDNWNSPNHVNDKGNIDVARQGYAITELNCQKYSGFRASPSAYINNENEWIGVHLENFWECFPSSIRIDESGISIGLFPAQENIEYELQGGEKKRFVIYLSSSNIAQNSIPQDTLAFVRSPPHSSLSMQTYKYACVIPGLCSGSRNKGYEEIVDICLDEKVGFSAKRETTDEFGWRHFGDLVADHETWGQTYDGIYCSHYNNQYDAIYGLYIRYVLTSDRRWYLLLLELAEHVLDIDIYDTADDRAEYNHGLFWHTDHYVRAKTCTHRTYSAKNAGIGLSGGPGGEHCYTTGLRYYYYLTGDARAKSTVVNMAHWVRSYYNGSGTLTERLIKIVRSDFPELIKLIMGKQVSKYEYEMHRGIGNFVVALVDAFELTSDISYLNEAILIVKNTAGPMDNIADRDFDDIEKTWFYTIFLQAVVRVLDCLRTNNKYGLDFTYCRQLLLHYALWMAHHETPYLHRKEKLEYVNHTWAAQDIRKAMIMYAAARYADHNNSIFVEKAEYFKRYVLENIKYEETRYYTRIQVILLQNQGEFLCANPDYTAYPVAQDVAMQYSQSQHSVNSKLRSMWMDIISSFMKFSLSSEIHWVKVRVGLRRVDR